MENTNEKQPIILKGQLLIKLGVKNLNNHIYLNNENLQEQVIAYNERSKEFGGFGELGYPENFDIAFSNISHKVTNVRIEDDAVIGDVELLDVSKANIIKENINDFVFRPRSTGRVKEDGIVVLDKIFAFDAVHKDTDAFASDDCSPIIDTLSVEPVL